VLLLAIGIGIGKTQGLIGIGIGTGLSAFSIWSLALMTDSFLRYRPQPRDGVQRTVLVSILKLPIMMLLIFLGTRLSGVGLGCFLVSIALVYSSFIAFRSFSEA
jgi:hypothetical protein